MAKALLMIEGVSKTYGHKKVLENLSFDIRPGEIFGIIGMSGVGKSTLLNTITGIIEPEEGKVLFKHPRLGTYTEVLEHKSLAKKIFGFATQHPSFYPNLTVVENLDYFGTLFGLEKEVLRNNIKTALTMTALENDRATPAKDLSGGMQKRLDIGCTIVADPDVIILDEPTADLDPVLREHMWSLIKKINATGTTLIVASHFIEELEKFCDRIGILHDRKMMVIGSVEEVKKKFGKYEEMHIETAPGKYEGLIKRIKSEDKKNSIHKIINKGHEIIVYSPDSEEALHHVLHAIEDENERLLNIGISKISLEKIFTSLIKGKGR